METNKVKCTKCGYVFETDVKNAQCTCPLCTSEINTKDALEFFEAENQNDNAPEKKRSAKRIILDWTIFAVGLVLFISILTYLFEFILGK